jgi:hypothetical protein
MPSRLADYPFGMVRPAKNAPVPPFLSLSIGWCAPVIGDHRKRQGPYMVPSLSADDCSACARPRSFANCPALV